MYFELAIATCSSLFQLLKYSARKLWIFTEVVELSNPFSYGPTEFVKLRLEADGWL